MASLPLQGVFTPGYCILLFH